MTGRSVAECQMAHLQLYMAILHQRSNPQLPIQDLVLNVMSGSLHNLNNYGKLR